MLRNPTNQGIGAAMKRVFQYAIDHDYDVLVIHAGNDKDDPLEIPALLAPLENGAADFVQGSRYLGGGGFGNMPAYRVFGDASGPPADLFAGRAQAGDSRAPTAFARFARRSCATRASTGGRRGSIVTSSSPT